MSTFLKKKTSPLVLMDLAPNTTVIRGGSFHPHGNEQNLKKKRKKKIVLTSLK